MSIRFVPEQDAAHLIAALTSHVRGEFARVGSANSVAVHVQLPRHLAQACRAA